MWNQSQGVLGRGGNGCSLWPNGTWSALFHWNSTLPVRDVDLLNDAVDHGLVGGPPIDVRSAVAVV